MGQSSGKFLEPTERVENHWAKYAAEKWRSKKMRDLDEAGGERMRDHRLKPLLRRKTLNAGPHRPAVRQGDSFTASTTYMKVGDQSGARCVIRFGSRFSAPVCRTI